MLRYPVAAFALPFTLLTYLIPYHFLGRAFSVDGRAVGLERLAGYPDFGHLVVLGTILGTYAISVFFGMGAGLKQDQRQGVLESNWVTPAGRLPLLLGRSLAHLAVTTVQVAFLVAGATPLFGLPFHLHTLGTLVTVLLPTLAGLYGLGLVIAGIVLLVRQAESLLDITSWAMNTLSGQSFPVSVLPRGLLLVSLAIPLTYGIDALRGAVLGTRTLLPLPTSLLVLWGLAVLLTAAGLGVFAWAERRARQLGLLGMH